MSESIERKIRAEIERRILELYPEYATRGGRGVRGRNFLVVIAERRVNLNYMPEPSLDDSAALVSAEVDATVGVIFYAAEDEALDVEPFMRSLLLYPRIEDEAGAEIALVRLPITTAILEGSTMDREYVQIPIRYRYAGDFAPAELVLLERMKEEER